MSSCNLPSIPGLSLPPQCAPDYVYFAPETFGPEAPSYFTMEPTSVVNYYTPPITTGQYINQVYPRAGLLDNPAFQSALLTGGTSALGGLAGGAAGAALGGAAGPILYSAITPEEEPRPQVAVQSGASAIGGTLGVPFGPLGIGLGAAIGGYLGYRLTKKHPRP